MTSSSAPRLALVELLLVDRWRHFRNEAFPFVQGFCAAVGVPAERLRVGVSPGDVRPPAAHELPPDDRERLAAAMRAFAPTHVVLTEVPGEATAAALAAACPGATVLCLGELGPGDPTPLDRVATLAAWLGLPVPADPDALLVDAAQPLYALELLNELAGQVRALVNVVCGPECHYARSVTRNPCFAGVTLDPRSRTYGCSFCGAREIERPRPATPLVDLALRQIVRAAAAPDPHGALRAFLVPGAFVADRLPDLLQGLLEARVPPVELHVILRADQLLAVAAGLDAVLPGAVAAGHRLRFGPMGLENFSEAENQRFNKGLTLAEAVEAHALLARLEAAWPGAVGRATHNAFGYILFTPWTTLDDLRVNLHWAARLGLDLGGEIFLASRLRLHPHEPITRLAERDGLLGAEVAQRFGHARLREAHDLPWRFRHPEVATAERLLSRLPDLGGEGPDDALYAEVQAWVRALGRRRDAVHAAAAAVVDELAADPTAGEAQVLSRARARLAGRGAM